MAEYTTSGSTTALATRYDYLPGEFAPLQIETDNSTYSVHTDHLATPKLLTDSSGQVVWRSVRAAFGETTVNDDVDDNGVVVGFNIRFPGQYFDGESGLNYNYFRDYDPTTGRYIQSDPIGLDGGINTYGYALQKPLSYIDPLGLKCWTDSSTGTKVCDTWGDHGYDNGWSHNGDKSAFDPDKKYADGTCFSLCMAAKPTVGMAGAAGSQALGSAASKSKNKILRSGGGLTKTVSKALNTPLGIAASIAMAVQFCANYCDKNKDCPVE